MPYNVIPLQETKPGLMAKQIQDLMNKGYYPLGNPMMHGSQIIMFMMAGNNPIEPPRGEIVESAQEVEEPEPAPVSTDNETTQDTDGDAPTEDEKAEAIRTIRNVPDDID